MEMVGDKIRNVEIELDGLLKVWGGVKFPFQFNVGGGIHRKEVGLADGVD